VCLGALGVILLSIVPVALAGPEPGAAESYRAVPKGEQGAAPSTVILVGTIVALDPEIWNLLVDVRFQYDVLRVGACMTQNTRVSVAGAPAGWEDLEPGARIRIGIRRMEGRTEAVSVEILSLPTG
jgi:hypothetical protein